MEWLSAFWDGFIGLHMLPYTPQDIVTKAMCHFTFGFLVGSLVLPLWTTLAALRIICPTAGVESLRDRFNALIAFPLRVMVLSAATNVFVDVDHLSLLFGPRDDHGRMLHGFFFWIGAAVVVISTVQAIRLVRRSNTFSEVLLRRYILCGFIGFSTVMHVFQDHLKNWWF